MKKKAQGTSVSAKSNDGVLKYTKWKDNQVVSVLSTVYGKMNKHQGRRWSRDDKKLFIFHGLQLLQITINKWVEMTAWDKT